MLVMVHHHPASGYIRIRNKYALGRDKHSERQICPEIVCEAAICRQHGRICNSSFLVIDGLNSAATDRVNIEHNLGERHLNTIIFGVFKEMFLSIHMDTFSCRIRGKMGIWSNNVSISEPANMSVHVEMIHFKVYTIFVISHAHLSVATYFAFFHFHCMELYVLPLSFVRFTIIFCYCILERDISVI